MEAELFAREATRLAAIYHTFPGVEGRAFFDAVGEGHGRTPELSTWFSEGIIKYRNRGVAMKALIVIAAVVLSSFVSAAHGAPCLAGLRKAMIEGGFSGALVCSRNDASFALVGRTSGSQFSIYNYRYGFLAVKGGVMHGDQRLVVFRHGRYIGQYVLDPMRPLAVTVKGTTVMVMDKATHDRARLDFSKRPPKEARLYGDLQTFGR